MTPLSVLGLINIIVTYTQVWYIIGIVSSSPTHFHSEKIGLIRVTYDPLPVLGLINIKSLSLFFSLSLFSLFFSLSLSFFSLSLSFFSFRSDYIELDFKEISYLVLHCFIAEILNVNPILLVNQKLNLVLVTSINK